MAFTKKLLWNGEKQPFPSTFTFTDSFMDSDKSKRNPINSKMTLKRIGLKRKIDFEWRADEETAAKLGAFFKSGRDGGTITFVDPSVGNDNESWQGYCAEYVATFKSVIGDKYKYTITFSVIEL